MALNLDVHSISNPNPWWIEIVIIARGLENDLCECRGRSERRSLQSQAPSSAAKPERLRIPGGEDPRVPQERFVFHQ